MKKVVTLVLVFSMVSMASAAMVNLTLSTLDPHTLVLPGTVITVDFSIDQDIKTIDASTAASSPGIDFTVTGGTNALALGSWELANIGSLGIDVGALDGTANAIEGATANWTVAKAAGTILYSFDLTINEDGTLGMAGLDNDDFVVIGGFPPSTYDIGTVTGFDVTIIPEPATMALLGLGGLLLRRKK